MPIKNKKSNKTKPSLKVGKNILRSIITVITVVMVIVLGLNAVVCFNALPSMYEHNEYKNQSKKYDCVIVLGCGVNGYNPSTMLKDRLDTAIDLYKKGVANKLLMSGDHGRQEYNEVGAMKEVAVKSGIASSDVFMDHAGFSTYESIYRAKEIFGADKIVIVTQKYHLYRALYIAKQLGIEAYGVESDFHTYKDATKSEFREILARVKDFGMAFLKPKPTYLGTPIAINGNGDVTNDYRDY